MQKKDRKVHTGFRLSKDNVKMIQRYENNLGINKTSVVDMILTVVRKDERLVLDLIKKAIEHRS